MSRVQELEDEMEDLRQELAAAEQENEELRARVEQLEQRNAELEDSH